MKLVYMGKKNGVIVYLLIGIFYYLSSLSCAYASAHDSSNISIHDQVSIPGEYIKLGDLFHGIEDSNLHEIIVSKGPMPGKKMTFNAIFLEKLARTHQLSWRPQHNSQSVTVYRSSTIIPQATILNEIEAQLRSQISQNSYELGFDQRLNDIHLPYHIPEKFEVANTQVFDQEQKFSAEIFAPSMHEPITQLKVTGKIHKRIAIPVLQGQISKDQIISDADVTWVQMPQNKVSVDTITDISKIVGYTPKRMVAAYTPVRLHELQAPMLIKKGQIVTITLVSPYMQITIKGKALQNGVKNEYIPFMNTQSDRVVEAKVVGFGRAFIDQTPNLAINLN